MATDKIGLIRYSDTGEVVRIVYPLEHEDETVLRELREMWGHLDTSRPRELVETVGGSCTVFGPGADALAVMGEVTRMSDHQVEAAAKTIAAYELFDWNDLSESDQGGTRDRNSFRIIAKAVLTAAHEAH